MSDALPGLSRGTALLAGEYRYYLTRRWGPGLGVTWVMLNPSTADADRDDPTVRKIVAFTRGWGYGALAVVNLFAYRTPYPERLALANDPVGPENDRWVEHHVRAAALVVAAWGGNELAPARAAALLPRFDGVPLHCLGTTKAGAPCHPGRLAYATILSVWTPPAREEPPCVPAG